MSRNTSGIVFCCLSALLPQVNNTADDDETTDGQPAFVVHGLTGDSLADIFEKDPNKLRLKAIQYFAKGGKVLGLGTSEKMESIWDNLNLYPSMFSWLFPYGYGGLGNEGIRIPVGDAIRKRNWLVVNVVNTTQEYS
jgi:hypothetical protein